MSDQWLPFDKLPAIYEGSGYDNRRGRRDFEYSIPHKIAEFDTPPIETYAVAAAETAIEVLLSFPNQPAVGGVLESLLLRSEVLNSSKIEGIDVSVRNLAAAEVGAVSKPSAIEVCQNLKALRIGLDISAKGKTLTVSQICDIHRQLMSGKSFAGKIRQGIVWIGGGDTPAKNPVYVAPPDDRVEDLLSDFCQFWKKDLGNFIVKLAVAHAQFESIHPFLDGNGRTGRILNQMMFAQAGLPLIPVSACLFAARDFYYETFNSYRDGDVSAAVFVHAGAIISAGEVLLSSMADSERLKEEWMSKIKAKANSPGWKQTLGWVMNNPIFSSGTLMQELGLSEERASEYLAKMESVGIIYLGRKKLPATSEQLWEAPEIYDFAQRIEADLRQKAWQYIVRV